MVDYWLISIVLTLYNKAPYIEETLFSIYNQSYKNRELIVVDDCSTDWSFEIAKSFCEKLGIMGKCKFIQNEKNLRVAKSFESWLKRAEWKRISMCDWDDILVKNHLEEKIKFCKKYNYEFCCWWCIDVDEHNNFIGFWNEWLFWKIHKIYLKNRTYKETLILPNAIWSAIFFNKSIKDILLKYGFPHNIPQDFWVEVCTSIFNINIWYIDVYLFYHRRCDSSISMYKWGLLHSYEIYFKYRINVAKYLIDNLNINIYMKKRIKERNLINDEFYKYIKSNNRISTKLFLNIIKRNIWFKHKLILLYQYFNTIVLKIKKEA